MTTREPLQNCSGDIIAVVLAAGCASRMGREKVLLALDGTPVIHHVVRSVRDAGLTDVVVVVNPRNEEAIGEALASLNVRTISNPLFHEGLASSIAVGVAAVNSGTEALMLIQGDQPLVGAAMLRRLITEWREHGTEFVAASYDDVTTTPVLFSRAVFEEMAALRGDVGARSVLRNHKGLSISFPAWCGADMDTEDDYRRIQQLWKTHKECSLS